MNKEDDAGLRYLTTGPGAPPSEAEAEFLRNLRDDELPMAHLSKPWYVVIEREERAPRARALSPWHGGNVVIGPFDTEQEACDHANDSTDVLDWLTEEAKIQGYIGGDVTWTQDPEIPKHGINAPIYDEE